MMNSDIGLKRADFFSKGPMVMHNNEMIKTNNVIKAGDFH